LEIELQELQRNAKKNGESVDPIIKEDYLKKINLAKLNPENDDPKNIVFIEAKSKLKIYKRTESASITGDTIGDPMKDTSGPSLNILIKLSSIISVVFGSLFLNTHYLV